MMMVVMVMVMVLWETAVVGAVLGDVSGAVPVVRPVQRILDTPTQTEGLPDTTSPDDWYSKYVPKYTWPELWVEDLSWPTSTPWWPPSQMPDWPKDRRLPKDPKMYKFPPFDPWVWGTTTEMPSRKYGMVLLAHGYYMLVYVRGEFECSTLIFQEKIFDYLQRKDCLPSYNKNWFWTYPWVPETIHTLFVKDRSSKKLMIKEQFFSLPEEPPLDIDLDIKTGIGWLQLKFIQPPEKAPTLVGYVLYYRTDISTGQDRWLDVISMYVVYNEDFPYVRPTHPCKSFRHNKTFCITAMDHFQSRHGNDKQEFYFQLLAFRLGPGPWKPYLVKQWKQKANPCFWVQEECDELEETGGKTPRVHRDIMDHPEITRPPPVKLFEGPPELRAVSNATEGPASLRPLMQEDLCVLFAGLTVGLLLVAAPCVFFLGRRAGQLAATDRWTRLSAAAGTVNVPLGHGGAYWRGRRSLPP